jgi:hypothetical protein
VIHKRGVVYQEEEAADLTQVGNRVHDEVETESYNALLVICLELLRLNSAPEGTLAPKSSPRWRLGSDLGRIERNLGLRLCQVFQPEDFLDYGDLVVHISVKDLGIEGVLRALAHAIRVG